MNLLSNAGDPGFDPWVRKIPWRRAWQPTPAWSACLEDPMDRGALWASVAGVAKSGARLSHYSVTSVSLKVV